MKQAVQRFGKFLSGMVMPNIGAFIAWGFITALFIEDGWTYFIHGWTQVIAEVFHIDITGDRLAACDRLAREMRK